MCLFPVRERSAFRARFSVVRGRLAVLRAASALRSSSRWRLAAFLGLEVFGAFGGVGWGGDGVGWVAVWGFPVPGSTRVGRGRGLCGRWRGRAWWWRWGPRCECSATVPWPALRLWLCGVGRIRARCIVRWSSCLIDRRKAGEKWLGVRGKSTSLTPSLFRSSSSQPRNPSQEPIFASVRCSLQNVANWSSHPDDCLGKSVCQSVTVSHAYHVWRCVIPLLRTSARSRVP